MDKSWVKLYRKARDNEIMCDPIAWLLFSYVLLSVNRETGVLKTGRIYLSSVLKINQSTIYKALLRLEKKYHLVTTVRTTTHTEISVSKWAMYQSRDGLGNNEVTTKEQPSNTIQEVRSKNKEYKDINSRELMLTKNQLEKLQKEFPYLNVQLKYQKFKEWQRASGKTFRNVLARFRMWLIEDVDRQQKTNNAIVNDPIFKRYAEVYRSGEDWAVRAKMLLLPSLETKYPLWRYQKEWEEVKKRLREEVPVGTGEKDERYVTMVQQLSDRFAVN